MELRVGEALEFSPYAGRYVGYQIEILGRVLITTYSRTRLRRVSEIARPFNTSPEYHAPNLSTNEKLTFHQSTIFTWFFPSRTPRAASQ